MTYIKLDQFLKLVQVTASGGAAKILIQNRQVEVNGQIETRRGRKLKLGDSVEIQGQGIYTVNIDNLN
jgi:ribosome-associated protein